MRDLSVRLVLLSTFLVAATSLAESEDEDVAQRAARHSQQCYHLGQSGHHADALEHCQEALKLIEEVHPPKSAKVAAALSRLAIEYHLLGSYAKAEPLLLRALEIYEETLGPKHAAVATTLSNLGQVYEAMRDYRKAERLLQRALSMEGVQGRKDPTILNNLAAVYTSQERYSKAEEMLLDAVRSIGDRLRPPPEAGA